MPEATGIYRGEVLAIMGVLADIRADVVKIRALLDDDDDGEEEEEQEGDR